MRTCFHDSNFGDMESSAVHPVTHCNDTARIIMVTVRLKPKRWRITTRD